MADSLKNGLSFLPLKMSRNDILHNFDPAPLGTPNRNGLSYVVEIWRQSLLNAANVEHVVTLPTREIPPRQIGSETVYDGAYIRIEEIIDELLEWKKPSYQQNKIGVIRSQTTRYRLLEKILQADGTVLSNSEKILPDVWVMKCGLQRADWSSWQSSFYTGYVAQKRPFLTWQPNQKIISKYQEEYLYFLINFTPLPTEIRMRIRVEMDDDSEWVATIHSLKAQNVKQYSVLSVPVGFEALHLNEVDGEMFEDYFDLDGVYTAPAAPRAVMAYELWLSDGDNARLSEVRRYEVDWEPQRFERQLLFNNSMGGYDTLRLTGKAQQQLKTSRMSAEVVELQKQDVDYSSLQLINVDGEKTWTVSTGYVVRDAVEWVNYMQEILLAEELYMVTEKGHIAMELVNTDVVYSEDDADLMARTFVLKEANRERNFSDMPAQGGLPDRPICWRGRDYEPLHDEWGVRNNDGHPVLLEKVYCDTGELVRPYTIKENLQGEEGYIESEHVAEFTPASTPYLSLAYSRDSVFRRNDCGANSEGSLWTIDMPAGAGGSETSQAEADANALRRGVSVDTQANANIYGVCRALCWAGIDYLPLHNDHGIRNGLKRAQSLQRVYCGTWEPVMPAQTKPNSINDPNYQVGVGDIDLTPESTPFLNVEIIKESVLKRNNCLAPMIGEGWTITIDEKTWGSETSQAEADALAMAEADSLDTQANANANGSCVMPFVVVEGESGTNASGQTYYTAPLASGGKISIGTGNPMEWIDIPFTLPTSKVWNLKIYYYADNSNNCNIKIDGINVGQMAVVSAWPYWTGTVPPKTVQMNLNISKGNHTIRFTAAANGVGNTQIDKIEFS